MQKVNLTQQKHTFTNQKKYTTTQNKHKKNKASVSHLLRHPAWKRRGPVLILALNKFVTYLDTYLLTGPGTHMWQKYFQRWPSKGTPYCCN